MRRLIHEAKLAFLVPPPQPLMSPCGKEDCVGLCLNPLVHIRLFYPWPAPPLSPGEHIPVLKRLGILSVAKIVAIIAAIFGVIIGVFAALAFALATGIGEGIPAWIRGIGCAAIIIFPIIYAIGGFVYGAIIAILYNIAASLVGGAELEFSQ
jgi:hypothetical protein